VPALKNAGIRVVTRSNGLRPKGDEGFFDESFFITAWNELHNKN